MWVHFIAIGGSAMHNLAIALHKKGMQITGSDDDIFDPARSHLQAHDLLPKEMGWHTSKITPEIDAVVLGMHAKEDNPELQKAISLGLQIYSYPEYIYEQTKNKKRVVIAGSHGKTTITSMVLHVLKMVGKPADFLVGAPIEGFDCMVSLEEQNAVAILEGDEYLASPLDRRPKFHLYHPHIALLSGIAWDHINVFPTFENYLNQFKIFVDKIETEGTLIYFKDDANVAKIAEDAGNAIGKIAYETHAHSIEDGKTLLLVNQKKRPVTIFGKHNLQNLSGAKVICKLLGVEEEEFYNAIASFGGASKRLELLQASEGRVVYKDFAHSPSKLKASVAAMKEQYPEVLLVACLELHTFSSLNKAFLKQYKQTMNKADRALVYFDPEQIKRKRLTPLVPEDVEMAFEHPSLKVCQSKEEVLKSLGNGELKGANLLMMSSGNFGGIDLQALAETWLDNSLHLSHKSGQ